MAEEAVRIEVDVILAWPRRHLHARVSLPAGATVSQAVAAAGFPPSALAGTDGFAVHGELAAPGLALRDGDRVEVLRPLQVDPKDARRARAGRQRPAR